MATKPSTLVATETDPIPCTPRAETATGANVFLVATPLQAIEARHEFGLEGDSCKLVVFCSESSRNDEQTQSIVRQASWTASDTVGYSGKGFRSWKERFNEVSAIAADMERAQHLFIGDYAFDMMRHLAHRAVAGKFVVLDDGNSTLRIARARRDPAVPYHFMPHSFADWVKHLAKTRFRGMNRSLLDRLTFFTVYGLEPDHRTEVVPNTYRHLRGRLHVLSVNEETHFLGAALPDKNLMSEDVYLSYLQRALSRLGSGPVVYWPHRLETASKLARISSELGIEVRESTMPVECRLCSAPSIPKLIAGFFTSAFDTCRTLLGDRIGMRSFYIDPSDCAPSVRADVGEFYRHYDSYTAGNFELVRAF